MNNNISSRLITIGLLLLTLTLTSALQAEMPSDRISDIINTKHNFSTIQPNLAAGQTRQVESTTESRVCVFCHTPHGAQVYPEAGTNAPQAPLWNRSVQSSTYTHYDSATFDAMKVETSVKSKMCLSCHDGTLAIGEVAVLNGQQNVTIPMVGTNPDGTMPGSLDTGFTRNLGVDLTNDHPISFIYNDELATLDGELYTPSGVDHIDVRGARRHPQVPLEPQLITDGVPQTTDATVECTTCHDPHIRSTDPLQGNIKFLRLHRFQNQIPVTGPFDLERDISCLGCHEKAGWINSAHAHPTVADELYDNNSALLREFASDQSNSTPLPVWRASCLNCHDTHTVNGARFLLREGTDGVSAGPGQGKSGGNPAQEESCYGCHSADGAVLMDQGSPTFQAADIKTHFNKTIRMPITTADQPAPEEVHNTYDKQLQPQGGQWGKDTIEPPSLLGQDHTNRHVECTDCHNPHRTTRARLAMAPPGTVDVAGTHLHQAGIEHSNIASGVLRGTFGVQPQYTTGAGEAFGQLPAFYDVKRGDPGNNTSQLIDESYVTREYQVCLKCHSSYAYDQNIPLLSNSGGSTNSATAFPTGMDRYTDQAMEFQAPAAHRGETSVADTGADAAYITNNHRSWHPVMGGTGRDTVVTGISAASFVAPFDVGLGNQTMYCSDCHGPITAAGSVEPINGEDGEPWGPHGSNINFILKGSWDANTGTGNSTHLCFKCHNYNDYAAPNNTAANTSGFATNTALTQACMLNLQGNLHVGHANCLQTLNGEPGIRCSSCHAAVPHGFKNKALLVNLNDVGAEATGFVSPGNVIADAQIPYDNPPYYGQARLKVNTFQTSGTWTRDSCGTTGGCHQ